MSKHFSFINVKILLIRLFFTSVHYGLIIRERLK